ncbi:CDP-diacylglycerol--glycerol-3-phosphate 3-phosphatidyltransferase [Streptomyces massasporeus]|uniref:CDP-diacylglycerol--glycerol-3-phosphate 3-phosphatidyltransferase n=1 Tax=Streptomyces massasporeus TaxID=67324 RepID=UPI00167A30E0|nr:CDP-diacylglycerol--glycerol-3-phosphate 3-phosphatidyltransferase [Streptomyces massasporeus]GGV83306.1 CDP-diacylglycerol--glycerol-3-phosphate 3-phosphatidyltransferase [Streptomyces massasporeus]
MTGVPASAAGGASGARRAAAGAAAAASPAAPGKVAGTAAARSADGGAPGAEPGASSGGRHAGTTGAAAADETVPGEDAGLDAQDDGKTPRGAKIAAAAVNQASVWNIANLLTMLRLVLVPAFVALMLADGGYDPAWRSLAWAAFAIAMITDLFDGHLARTYNLVTDFGKIADPIADKAIMGAALICLSALGDLPWWVTGIILGRELGVTLLRFWVIRYGVIPASRGGKLKTLTQGVAVGMYVLALTGWLATLRWWVMAAAVVLTVVTGLDYVKQAIVLRRQGIAERKAALEEKEA